MPWVYNLARKRPWEWGWYWVYADRKNIYIDFDEPAVSLMSQG